MNFIKKYIKRCSTRRILVMLLGVVLSGLGIATFRLAVLGTDPYNAMNLALAHKFNIPYPTVQIIINCVFFVVQILWGRSLLGLGTLVNFFGLAYIVSFFYEIYMKVVGQPENLLLRVVILLIGLAVCSLGLSMYQQADLGVAPYDAFPLILTKKVKNSPFFVWRVTSDASCALVCFLAGGIGAGVLGFGTLVVAFGFGPVIQFFNHAITDKLLKEQV